MLQGQAPGSRAKARGALRGKPCARARGTGVGERLRGKGREVAVMADREPLLGPGGPGQGGPGGDGVLAALEQGLSPDTDFRTLLAQRPKEVGHCPGSNAQAAVAPRSNSWMQCSHSD